MSDKKWTTAEGETPKDIDEMAEAGQIVSEVLKKVREAAQSGMTTKELWQSRR